MGFGPPRRDVILKSEKVISIMKKFEIGLIATAMVTFVFIGLVYWNAKSNTYVTSDIVNHGISSDTSCGPVALAAISQYLGSPVSIEKFHELTNSGELGTCSFLDLQRALKTTGFVATSLRFNDRHPRNVSDPMILFVESNHFVAAIPINQKVIVIDPPKNPRVYEWSDLKDVWKGEAILVQKN